MKQFSWSKIKEYRIEKKLTQWQLARRVGVTVQQISAWELNDPEKSLTTAYLAKIAEVLNKRTDDFFVDDPEHLPGRQGLSPSRQGLNGPTESRKAVRP